MSTRGHRRAVEWTVYLVAAALGGLFAANLATAATDGSVCLEYFDHMEVDISQADPVWLAASPEAAVDKYVDHVRTGATDRIADVYMSLQPSDGVVREGRTDLVSAVDGLVSERGFLTVEGNGDGFLVTEATVCLTADEVGSDAVPADLSDAPFDSVPVDRSGAS